jgi:putative two-component system response regulator
MAKLLIVDDEPMTVEMLQSFLEINGYEAVGVYNGEDGLVMVQIENPAVLILDLMLPDIEGYDICKRIRTAPEFAAYANLPILIISARVEEASKRRAMEAGANGYLTKPVKFNVMLEELKRLISEAKPATATTEVSLAVTDTVAATVAPTPTPDSAPTVTPTASLGSAAPIVTEVSPAPAPNPEPPAVLPPAQSAAH